MSKQTIREWAIATFGKSPRVIAQYVTALTSCGTDMEGVIYDRYFYPFANRTHSREEMTRAMCHVKIRGTSSFHSIPIFKVTSIKCELLEG